MKHRPTTRVLAGVLLTGLALAFEPACGPKGTQGPPPAAPPPDKPGILKAKDTSHAVIFIDVDGKKVYPKKSYLWTGDGADDVREVWWIHTGDDVKIAFSDPILNNDPLFKIKCEAWGKVNRCRWMIKKNSIEKKIYPYEVKVSAVAIDPEVEIDR